jgi:two-component system phosphate regulon sensor histidine kinase PhoR
VMTTKIQQEDIQTVMNLLTESRLEADKLRETVQRYEKILLSTRLIMGHDLKRPTTAVAGYIDLVLESLEDSANPDEQTADTLSNLRQAREQCSLLNELNLFFFELLKLENEIQKPKVQTVELEGFIKRILKLIPEKLGAQKRVSLSMPAEVQEIQFNPDAFRLILYNVLENALLYSKKESEVKIDIEVKKDKRKMSGRDLVNIKITDEGYGIQEEYLKKIFSPFFRAHKEIAEGTGLGLTLVKSLIELCGGEISISSMKNQGTTVYLTIPICDAGEDSQVF